MRLSRRLSFIKNYELEESNDLPLLEVFCGITAAISVFCIGTFLASNEVPAIFPFQRDTMIKHTINVSDVSWDASSTLPTLSSVLSWVSAGFVVALATVLVGSLLPDFSSGFGIHTIVYKVSEFLYSRIRCKLQNEAIVEGKLEKDLEEDYRRRTEKLISSLRSEQMAFQLEMQEKVRKAKVEAVKELKVKHAQRIEEYRAEVQGTLKEQVAKYHRLKKVHAEVIASKLKLEEENDELKREMGQLRRDYLHSLNTIRILKIDQRKTSLGELEGEEGFDRTYSILPVPGEALPSSLSLSRVYPSGCIDDRAFDHRPFNKLEAVPSVTDAKPEQYNDRFSELHRRKSMFPTHTRSGCPSEFITCDDDRVVENKRSHFCSSRIPVLIKSNDTSTSAWKN